LRFAIAIGEHYGEMEHKGGKVRQRWRGSGVTFAYLIYWWVFCWVIKPHGMDRETAWLYTICVTATALTACCVRLSSC